jgi:hypothetical protein
MQSHSNDQCHQQTHPPLQTGQNNNEIFDSICASLRHPWTPETGLMPYQEHNPIICAGKVKILR